MDVGQGAGQPRSRPGDPALGEGALAAEDALERLARDPVHDEVGRPVRLARRADGDHVRVAEAGQGLGLADEAPPGVRVRVGAAEEELDRDVPVEARVAPARTTPMAPRAISSVTS